MRGRSKPRPKDVTMLSDEIRTSLDGDFSFPIDHWADKVAQLERHVLDLRRVLQAAIHNTSWYGIAEAREVIAETAPKDHD